MKHIVGILGISLNTAYVYRKKLSDKMQFLHNHIFEYAL